MLWILLSGAAAGAGYAQRKPVAAGKPLVYVDKKGILRFTANNKEAAFFGVNYTVPFAHGYRAHKRLGADLKKAIDNDVYHFARLGLDAFRVHVWDTEITDAEGNLLQNEHLDLFDYLISKLKERNIKILLTPIAFWGNGYPEKDENTGSFSMRYGKQGALVNDTAIRAQENYLEQFFAHVNPYTGLTYTNDPDIIATEINNEPHHSGPLAGATAYINRMAAAIKSKGWNKPVFYNISESPWYAAAVANANIDGVSFQWYPTGLVANRTLQGNFLPNVDKYSIPFDTIPAYKNKARVVYEFDAGDVLQPIMYPAMARSFRTAGFQWATQFAYDPMLTAQVNTEYQTHYLNLAYTPAKAISLLIAGKVFHQAPLYKNYGNWPADTAFEAATISYSRQRSEWNTPEEYYYTGSTGTAPVAPQQLKKIAGIGNSPLIQYSGTGAYFLDKIEEGIWRLEVMPDIIALKDPFEKTAPTKELRRVLWSGQQMNALLPNLGDDFVVSAVNRDNSTRPKVSGTSFTITPGTYLLMQKGKTTTTRTQLGNIGIAEFAAPQPAGTGMALYHVPAAERSAGAPATLRATIAGIDTTAIVQIQGNRRGDQWFTIKMERQSATEYTAALPASLLQPGVLNYSIIVQQQNEYTAFPGNIKGDPAAWHYTNRQTWETHIAATGAPWSLLNVTRDNDLMMVPAYTPGAITAGSTPGSLAVRLSSSNNTTTDTISAISRAVAAQLQGRSAQEPAFTTLVLRARSATATPATARVALITGNANAFVAELPLQPYFTDLEIPLQQLTPGQSLLLPRPYPGFQPLWFKGAGAASLNISQLDKIEISGVGRSYTIEIESLWLKVK